MIKGVERKGDEELNSGEKVVKIQRGEELDKEKERCEQESR